MDFLEKDLEEIICNSNRELLRKRGLYLTGKLLRQFRIGNYGVVDFITVSKEYEPSCHKIVPILDITVYELKKDTIGISAFLQAIGYVKGIKRYFQKRNINYEIVIRIVLIGKTIDTNSTFIYFNELCPALQDGTAFLTCMTYKYDLAGLQFKDVDAYTLIEEGF